jgi:putative membrane protein
MLAWRAGADCRTVTRVMCAIAEAARSRDARRTCTRRVRVGITALGVLLFTPAVLAQVPGEVQADGSTMWLSAMLALSLGLYAFGLLRLWPHVHARADLWRRATAFAAGWLTLVLALSSPIDRGAHSSLALHTIQHELLMLVAAPLLVYGRALPTFLWSLPHDARVSIGLATKARWIRRGWNAVTAPLSAWALFALALWIWHIPAVFNAAVLNEAVHDWQHASFLVAALVFWHALLRHGRHVANGMAVLYLFTTAVHTGMLGALLTFADNPLYFTLNLDLRTTTLSTLEDQRLGGLIMWLPAAIVYASVGLYIASKLLRGAGGKYPSSAARS